MVIVYDSCVNTYNELPTSICFINNKYYYIKSKFIRFKFSNYFSK